MTTTESQYWLLFNKLMKDNALCAIPMKSPFPEMDDDYLPVRILWAALAALDQRISALENKED